jgi:hypothetical protein
MMSAFIDRVKNFFNEPLIPPAALQISRTCLSGVRRSPKERKLASHFILPLADGVIEPSFDRRNIVNPGALEKALREGILKIDSYNGPAALLLPETCLKVFVMGFDSLPSSPAEREEILIWRLNKLVPFKPADMRMAYDVLRSNGQAKVLLALAKADVVKEYENFFGRLGLKVRTVGVPLLYLLDLARLEKPGHAMIVNFEEDYVSLLAVLDGQVSFYRFKPFLQDSLGPMTLPRKIDQVVNEIENTVRFIEDREKKKILAVRVRTAIRKTEGDVPAALNERLPSLVIRGFAVSLPLPSPDQQVLSPLIGQVL